jgi:hypothetical protein
MDGGDVLCSTNGNKYKSKSNLSSKSIFLLLSYILLDPSNNLISHPLRIWFGSLLLLVHDLILRWLRESEYCLVLYFEFVDEDYSLLCSCLDLNYLYCLQYKHYHQTGSFSPFFNSHCCLSFSPTARKHLLWTRKEKRLIISSYPLPGITSSRTFIKTKFKIRKRIHRELCAAIEILPNLSCGPISSSFTSSSLDLIVCSVVMFCFHYFISSVTILYGSTCCSVDWCDCTLPPSGLFPLYLLTHCLA